MRLPSSLLILGIISFCLLEIIYVSIPDFPYSAKPWELMLWGERSQWWSEVTWILLFGIFSILSILLMNWNSELNKDSSSRFSQNVIRFLLAFSCITLSFHFSTQYFEWHGWTRTFALDSGGYLHGLFYLWTFFLGLLCFEEFVVWLSGVHSAIVGMTNPRKVPGCPQRPHVTNGGR